LDVFRTPLLDYGVGRNRKLSPPLKIGIWRGVNRHKNFGRSGRLPARQISSEIGPRFRSAHSGDFSRHGGPCEQGSVGSDDPGALENLLALGRAAGAALQEPLGVRGPVPDGGAAGAWGMRVVCIHNYTCLSVGCRCKLFGVKGNVYIYIYIY